MDKTFSTIAEYIAQSPQEHREKLQNLYQTIKAAAPLAEEGFNYGMPSFKQGKPVIYFNLFPKHLGIYPTPPVVEHFQEALKPYKTSKGAVQIPLDQDLPLPLISEMVAYRLKLIEAEKKK